MRSASRPWTAWAKRSSPLKRPNGCGPCSSACLSDARAERVVVAQLTSAEPLEVVPLGELTRMCLWLFRALRPRDAPVILQQPTEQCQALNARSCAPFRTRPRRPKDTAPRAFVPQKTRARGTLTSDTVPVQRASSSRKQRALQSQCNFIAVRLGSHDAGACPSSAPASSRMCCRPASVLVWRLSCAASRSQGSD